MTSLNSKPVPLIHNEVTEALFYATMTSLIAVLIFGWPLDFEYSTTRLCLLGGSVVVTVGLAWYQWRGRAKTEIVIVDHRIVVRQYPTSWLGRLVLWLGSEPRTPMELRSVVVLTGRSRDPSSRRSRMHVFLGCTDCLPRLAGLRAGNHVMIWHVRRPGQTSQILDFQLVNTEVEKQLHRRTERAPLRVVRRAAQ